MGIPTASDPTEGEVDEDVSEPFPVRSRNAAAVVDDIRTEISCMMFADKILVTIAQEGRLAQWVNGLTSFICKSKYANWSRFMYLFVRRRRLSPIAVFILLRRWTPMSTTEWKAQSSSQCQISLRRRSLVRVGRSAIPSVNCLRHRLPVQ